MAANNTSSHIESVQQEGRTFPPPKEFSRRAQFKSLAQYRKLYRESIQSPEKFWSRQAKAELVWFKRWTRALKWEEPYAGSPSSTAGGAVFANAPIAAISISLEPGGSAAPPCSAPSKTLM